MRVGMAFVPTRKCACVRCADDPMCAHPLTRRYAACVRNRTSNSTATDPCFPSQTPFLVLVEMMALCASAERNMRGAVAVLEKQHVTTAFLLPETAFLDTVQVAYEAARERAISVPPSPQCRSFACRGVLVFVASGSSNTCDGLVRLLERLRDELRSHSTGRSRVTSLYRVWSARTRVGSTTPLRGRGK